MSQGVGAILIQSDTTDVPWEEFDFDLPESHVIALLYRLSDDRWVTAWEEHVGSWPVSMHILAAQTTTRRGPSSPGSQPPEKPGFTITEITPENLTQTGVQITDALSGIDTSEHPLLVYCDSVTTLLQFTDLQTTYRFLHTLIGHVNAAGGTTYIQIDPAAHDDKTLSTFAQLFDTIVEV